MRYEEDLNAVLMGITAGWDIPGMAVGIVEGDEITYTFCTGVQNLNTGIAVTPRSIFCTASVSKCFVATTVMQLVHAGKIDLDEPIVRYLPYFQMTDERYQHITTRQLLSHTSGMPDFDENEYDDLVSHPQWDEGAAERFVRGLNGLTLLANPGEEMHYSNIGYDILGDVIAKVSGKPFEEVIKAMTLAPAGMPGSTFLLSEVEQALLAVPHLRSPEMKVNPIYPYHRADAPASFLHASLEEMCHWAVTTLNRGEYNGTRLLPADMYDQMWTSVADRGYGRPGIYEDMGLGWTLGHFKG
ncbi:MAG TPA: serine hydrolase domain-containing protein, partial [Longilinea sp.]|nr:serine hydrolase domain-containing protein [Longilinea sp.]